jgi:membrane-associated protease RseP (regulator of RpoE activity)
MKRYLVLGGVVLVLHNTDFARGEPPTVSATDAVVMKPFKVPSRGWNVYWSRTFPIWGRIAEMSVDEVDAGSLAGKAGLKDRDEVLSINGKPVKGMKEQEMKKLMWPSAAATIVLEVKSKGSDSARTVELRIPDHGKAQGSHQ